MSGVVLRFSEHRSAAAALQQGAARPVSAGLDVQARDVGHRARGQPDRLQHAHAAGRAPATTTSAIARGSAGRRKGTAASTSHGAIAQSCDVYFYQLGQKITLSRLVAGGVGLGFDKKTGIDLPEEKRPLFPSSVPDYFNQKYGPRGWTSGDKEFNLADRSGRECADRAQHGALLQRAGDGRYASRRR